jgi:hypothetical protein
MIIGGNIVTENTGKKSIDFLNDYAWTVALNSKVSTTLFSDSGRTGRPADGGAVYHWDRAIANAVLPTVSAPSGSQTGIYRASSSRLNGRPGVQLIKGDRLAGVFAASRSMRDFTLWMVLDAALPIATGGDLIYINNNASSYEANRFLEIQFYQAGDGPRPQIDMTGGDGQAWEANVGAGPWLYVIEHNSSTRSFKINGIERDSGTFAYQAAVNALAVNLGGHSANGRLTDDTVYGAVYLLEGTLPATERDDITNILKAEFGFTF